MNTELQAVRQLDRAATAADRDRARSEYFKRFASRGRSVTECVQEAFDAGFMAAQRIEVERKLP